MGKVMKNNADLYDIIRYPVSTEKAQKALDAHKKHVFKVCANTTKGEVKRALETLFNVKVAKINSVSVPGKIKIFKGIKGKRQDYKKVIITLAEGSSLNFNEGIN